MYASLKYKVRHCPSVRFYLVRLELLPRQTKYKVVQI
jgi:hypothetical protein